jgi:hypothetical protein
MTFGAIMLVGLAAAYALILLPTIVEKSRADAEGRRFEVANAYVIGLEEVLLKRLLHGASYAALQVLINESNASIPKAFYTELGGANPLQQRFNDSLIAGLYGSGVHPALAGRALGAQLELLENLTNATHHFRLDITPRGAILFQDDRTGPWAVGVLLTFDYTVNAGVAAWQRTGAQVNASVPLLGLFDPYISVKSGGAAANTIRPTQFASWNTTGLLAHLGARTYRFNPEAPSFLSRLKGDLAPSECCGIESLINRNIYTALPAGSPYHRNAHVDYCFWDSPPTPLRCATTTWTVAGVTDYPFRLDPTHIESYGASQGTEKCNWNSGTSAWDCITA